MFIAITAFGQNNLEEEYKIEKKDSLPIKVDHAEPLYVDLMRDLGARKGEAEFNLGLGRSNYKNYNQFYGFVEYEWAIANRLGMEVEVPFSFNNSNNKSEKATVIPKNKIEGIKLATQYTFLVNDKRKLSMAVGYVHEFELNALKQLNSQNKFFTGMRMNPIGIAAKNFKNWNTLLYTGPVLEYNFKQKKVEYGATINTSLLYVIPNTKNFIGVENNMDIDRNGLHDVIRPQIKISIKHNLMVGLVGGIPLTKKDGLNGDIMTRIIWEP